MRGELWMDIRNDYLKGISISEISRTYNINWRTAKKYAEEYYGLKAEQEEIEERLSEIENANQRAKNFIKLAESYCDFGEITLTAINEFINKIVVMSEM